MTADLGREQVSTFRSAGHGLGWRLPAGGLVAAAARIGLRRTKLTAVALAARVEAVGAGALEDALEAGQLVTVYGARGTLMVVPAADAEVFTLGTAPAGRASLRAAVPGAFLRRLDSAGMEVDDALAAVVDAVREALAGGPCPRGETAAAVTRALTGPLAPPCRGRCPDPHVEDSLFRLAGVLGVMRFAGASDDLVAMGEPARSHTEARGELVRRYLRCYGPATPATLAEWAGISTGDAAASLAALGEDVVTVTHGPSCAAASAGRALRPAPACASSRPTTPGCSTATGRLSSPTPPPVGCFGGRRRTRAWSWRAGCRRRRGGPVPRVAGSPWPSRLCPARRRWTWAPWRTRLSA